MTLEDQPGSHSSGTRGSTKTQWIEAVAVILLAAVAVVTLIVTVINTRDDSPGPEAIDTSAVSTTTTSPSGTQSTSAPPPPPPPPPSTTTTATGPIYLLGQLEEYNDSFVELGIVRINGEDYASGIGVNTCMPGGQPVIASMPEGGDWVLRGVIGYPDGGWTDDDGMQIEIDLTTDALSDDPVWVTRGLIDVPERGVAPVDVPIPAGTRGIRLDYVKYACSVSVAYGDLRLEPA